VPDRRIGCWDREARDPREAHRVFETSTNPDALSAELSEPLPPRSRAAGGIREEGAPTMRDMRTGQGLR